MDFLGKLIFYSLLFAVCSGNLTGTCEETASSGHMGAPVVAAAAKASDEDVGAWLASLYRDSISRVDSDRCPSLPSCSSYSYLAFRKHGFFMGWLLTVDRLIHEADEGSFSPVVYHQGRFKVLDPVENNDFWWFQGDGSTQQ